MRTIEIIFWGLALFIPQQNGYRVLLPDGRNVVGIPPHRPVIDIRPTEAKPKPVWGTWPN